jgi:serine O-acetyltransferase
VKKSNLISIIKEDLAVYSKESFFRIILTLMFNVSFRLLLNYRIGAFLSKRRNYLINIIILFLKRRQLFKYSSDISYSAIIGKRLKIQHPLGIVIGSKAVLCDDVSIWQNVTIGSHGGENESKVYPHIGKGVKLFSGCQIIGGITIGKYSKIGAGSIVLKNIPDNSTAVGVPAKII